MLRSSYIYFSHVSGRTGSSSQPGQVDLRLRYGALPVSLRLARGVFRSERLGGVVSPHVAQVSLHGAGDFTAQVCLLERRREREGLARLGTLCYWVNGCGPSGSPV